MAPGGHLIVTGGAELAGDRRRGRRSAAADVRQPPDRTGFSRWRRGCATPPR
ncbi:MAG: hypothetical protein U0703_11595 [Anaerolineae bacterium]